MFDLNSILIVFRLCRLSPPLPPSILNLSTVVTSLGEGNQGKEKQAKLWPIPPTPANMGSFFSPSSSPQCSFFFHFKSGEKWSSEVGRRWLKWCLWVPMPYYPPTIQCKRETKKQTKHSVIIRLSLEWKSTSLRVQTAICILSQLLAV